MNALALALTLAVTGSSDFMRGMTVSCPGYGRIWGSPAMRYAARQLVEDGVGWVAIHPYGGVRTDGSIRFEDPLETGYMMRSIDISRAEGLRVFWKPHLAYWGSFEWRGAIEFGEDEAAWRRFFSDYEAFIVAHARFAEKRKIPIFAIGLEYEKTLSREKEWRKIIAAVRRVYRGQITYGANWDAVARVPFWDALDLIGVQAYFPLSGNRFPDAKAIEKGWDRVLGQLSALSRKHDNKKILFTEIGYARYEWAAREPWKPAIEESKAVLELRTRLLDAAFRRMDHPMIRGAFWWKWIPGNNAWDRDFSMKDPEARRSLRKHWKKP